VASDGVSIDGLRRTARGEPAADVGIARRLGRKMRGRRYASGTGFQPLYPSGPDRDHATASAVSKEGSQLSVAQMLELHHSMAPSIATSVSPKVRLRGTPWTQEFMAANDDAMGGTRKPAKRGISVGTWHWICTKYFAEMRGL